MTSMTPNYYVPHLQAGADGPAGGPGAYQSKVRWGRLAIVAVSVGILLFTGSQLLSGGNDQPRSADGTSSALSGGGFAKADSSSDSSATSGSAEYTPPPAGDTYTPRSTAGSDSFATSRRQGSGSPKARTSKQAAAGAAAAARKKKKHRTAAAGGGTAGPDDLPFTGAPTWLAAVLGAALLGGGLLLQTRAPAVAHTASGYRRGPLLRPIDKARELHRRWYHWRLDIALKQ